MYSNDLLADDEAPCTACRKVKPLRTMLTCRCERYGYPHHADLVWCSEECLDADHPDVMPEVPDAP